MQYWLKEGKEDGTRLDFSAENWSYIIQLISIKN